MKTTFITMLLLAVGQCLMAGQLTVQVARQRAAAMLGSDERLQLVLQGTGEQPAYYVFNRPEGKGFAIVGGDDRMERLLGWGDKGSIDPADMPPALLEWLEQCERQVVLLREGKASLRRAVRRAAPIAPMITTEWGQRSPYNDLTPYYEGEYHSATGCLATAMAQLLKYWHSATPTAPIPAYTTETLGIRMEALPATTFNYDIMLDSYGGIYAPESAQEVARLMLYCGQAAEMDYDFDSGAVTSGKYLARYFGFRTDYTDKYHATHLSDWEGLLYEELEAGRPMLYSGKKITGAGHVFVVDGYKDGYFHVNWGWYGSSNGYFDITLANPDDPDSAYLWEGYRWTQMAVIGLQPAASTAVRPIVSTPTADNGEEVVYDLQGRRVAHTKNKGVYIVNGRLRIIK